jgi:hypothetical protein
MALHGFFPEDEGDTSIRNVGNHLWRNNLEYDIQILTAVRISNLHSILFLLLKYEQ